jgi:hypothetical protein
MATGQNDDIDPATATGRPPAASRARSAALTAFWFASATRAQAARLEGRPVGREGIGDDHFCACVYKVLVHGLDQREVFEVGSPAPGLFVHGYSRRLELGTCTAIDDDDLTTCEPPQDVL